MLFPLRAIYNLSQLHLDNPSPSTISRREKDIHKCTSLPTYLIMWHKH